MLGRKSGLSVGASGIVGACIVQRASESESGTDVDDCM